MRLFCCGLILLLPAVAVAADDVAIELRPRAMLDVDQPALILRANRAVVETHLHLVPSGAAAKGKGEVSINGGAIAAGDTLNVPLDAPVGVTHYTGELRVHFVGGGGGQMPLAFDVEVLPKLALTVDTADLDLAAGKLQVLLSRPADHCNYDITVDGKSARHGVARFSSDAGGGKLTVPLPVAADDVVLRIGLTCHDKDGYHISAELFPWRLDVPHEEVNFPTGESRIPKSEDDKIQRALADIESAVRRYGKLIKIRLFVVGHTDTVGDAGSNMQLSLSRARAIAAQLRAKGVHVPIAYAGMGESKLLVPTADEVDEVKNRRAQYILSVEEPLPLAWKWL